jgi:hypothetical protein
MPDDENPTIEALREVLAMSRDERMEYTNRDGSIRIEGVKVGHVAKLDTPGPGGSKWRAEVGDPAHPDTYRAAYAKTKWQAVEETMKENGE